MRTVLPGCPQQPCPSLPLRDATGRWGLRNVTGHTAENQRNGHNKRPELLDILTRCWFLAHNKVDSPRARHSEGTTRRLLVPLTCVDFCSSVFCGCCGGSQTKWRKQLSGASPPAQTHPALQHPPGWAHSPDCESLEKCHFPCHCLAPLERDKGERAQRLHPSRAPHRRSDPQKQHTGKQRQAEPYGTRR